MSHPSSSSPSGPRSDTTAPVTFLPDRVAVGDWSAGLDVLIETSAQLRGLLREGRHAEARHLLTHRCAEEQAALVAVDERPEELLSLTGMDDRGRPGYLPAVVDRLPSETIAELVAPADARLLRFNTTLLRSMSPSTLVRAVDETLDPVQFHADRSRVSWEWLEAVASLGEANRIADLLGRVDESILEEAFQERIEHFDMHALVGANGVTVSAFRLLAESASGQGLPPIDDPATRGIAHALFDAAPDLIKRVLRGAWERSGMAS